MSGYYTCSGTVRGDCGIKHRTPEAADRHARRDGKHCAAQGGYSDRVVVDQDGNVTAICGVNCDHEECL